MHKTGKMPIIAPSLLSANFLNLEKEFTMLNNSGAAWIHLDIMDGLFVPNLSFGIPIVAQCRKISNKIFDVHLMISNPEKYIAIFQEAGANNISFHIEVCPYPLNIISNIKLGGMKAGLAINPDTSIEKIFPYLKEVDFVCMMGVYPGFGGQAFIESTYQKIQELKAFIIKNKLATLIEIDGGVTIENAQKIVDMGADILVAGNTVFKSKKPEETIQYLQKIKKNKKSIKKK